MRRLGGIAIQAALPFLVLAMAGTAMAADNAFSAAKAGKGKVCYFGECEGPPADPPSSKKAPPPQMPEGNFDPADQNPVTQMPRDQEFGDESAPRPVPALPNRPPPAISNQANFSDEFTEFGIPPQPFLQFQVSGPTPSAIPGGRIVTTDQLRQSIESGRRQFLLIDAWGDQNHPTLPGAYHIPFAGISGDFSDPVQANLWRLLSQLTNGRPDYPLVFFCTGARCWESYNAALRAIGMGFSNVYWYRGGLGAWSAANLPLGAPASELR